MANGNIDRKKLKEQGKTTVLPIDLIMEAIDKAEFIGQMNKCICRSAHECTHYDKHIGCLFFNMAGVTAVNNGLARKVTKEEAQAHVYEARDAGLMGQALYVELEQMVWGFRNDKWTSLWKSASAVRAVAWPWTCAEMASVPSKTASAARASRWWLITTSASDAVSACKFAPRR